MSENEDESENEVGLKNKFMQKSEKIEQVLKKIIKELNKKNETENPFLSAKQKKSEKKMKAEKIIFTENKRKCVKKSAITTLVKALFTTLVNLDKKSRKWALNSDDEITFLKVQKKQC